MLRFIHKWSAGGLVLLFIVFCIWLIGSSKSFQQCVRATKQQEASNSLEKGIAHFSLVFRRDKGCTGVFITENKDAIGAVSTFVIAIFTATLWLATSRLWRASEEHASHAEAAIRISEETAKRQLRAYVSDTPVEIIVSAEANKIGIQFLFQNQNHGQTPARDVRHFIHAEILPHPLPENFAPSPALEDTARSPIPIAPRMTRIATREIVTFSEADMQDVYRGTTRRLYVFAITRYNDIYGNSHEIGLCVHCGGAEFATALDRARNAARLAPNSGVHAPWDFRYDGGDKHNYEW